MKKSLTSLLCACLFMAPVFSQQKSIQEMSWKSVARISDKTWFASAEAAQIAETLIACQRTIGGWPKNEPYHKLSASELENLIESKDEIGATIDNGATTMEMFFLAKVYQQQAQPSFKKAFIKGLEYLFTAQYENGGWPQFYPSRTGKSVQYASYITYNDDAMINVMHLLKSIYEDKAPFNALTLSEELKTEAKTSFNKGIQCILATQIKVDDQPTVWCAQHNQITLAPAKARKYELPSFSGGESVDITALLMEIENPSAEIIAAVEGAIQWFKDHELKGIRLEYKPNAKGEKDLFVVKDPTASGLWARFYDLETGEPFFCDRDGIKKSSIDKIGYERRTGYGWYNSKPKKLLNNYIQWKAKWNKE